MMRWAFIGRELRRQPMRAILTLLSIVLGVGSTVAVSLATQSTRSAYNQLFEKVGGPPTLEIISTAGDRFSQDLAEKVKSLPDVKAAIPVVFRPTVLRFKGKRINTVAVGIDLDSLPKNAQLDIESGKASTDAESAVLESALARSIQATVGDRVVMLQRRGVTPLTISGIASTQSALTLTDSGQVFVPLASLQEMFALDGKCDVIRVIVDRPNAVDAVTKSIEKLLPPNMEVHARVSRLVLSEETLMTAEQGMRFITVLCLAMSVFIIVNTFLMNLTERRTQFATLRMIGATRKQLQMALLLEGLVLGFVGTVLGTIVGIGGAWFINRAMEQLLWAVLIDTKPDIATLLSGVAVGLVVTLIACWIPARRAGKISPQEALSRVPDSGGDRFPRAVLAMSAVVWTVAAVLIFLVLRESIPPQLAVGAGVLMLGAFVLLIPLVLTPFSAWISRLLARVWHVESMLAQLQLMRRQTRTVLTIGVLVVAIANAIGMGNTVIDNISDVRQWYRDTMIGDFFLSHTAQQTASTVEAAGTESLADRVAKIPDVAEIESLRFINARVANIPSLLVARSFAVGSAMPLRLIDADARKVQEDLQAGKMVVGSVLARRAGLQVGDTAMVEVLGKTQPIQIAAIANDYNSGGMVAFLEQRHANALFGVSGENMLAVTAAPGKAEQIKPSLQEFAQANDMLVYSHAQLRASIEQLMLGVVAAFWALLAIGFFVAAFGVANTLTMSVHEQQREIGLLRIIGMTRLQVRRTILLQSIIIALIAVATGLLGGLTTAWIINLCMRPVLGHSVPFHTHWGLFVLVLLSSIVLAIASSWFPMRRAAQVGLLQVMSQE